MKKFLFFAGGMILGFVLGTNVGYNSALVLAKKQLHELLANNEKPLPDHPGAPA